MNELFAPLLNMCKQEALMRYIPVFGRFQAERKRPTGQGRNQVAAGGACVANDHVAVCRPKHWVLFARAH